VDAVIVADRDGALAGWRERLAAFPEVTRRERAMHRYVQLVHSLHYAISDDVRGFEMDRQINCTGPRSRALHLVHPPEPLGSPAQVAHTRDRASGDPARHARRSGGAVLNPSIEMLTHVAIT
jgi:hypothetical protein